MIAKLLFLSICLLSAEPTFEWPKIIHEIAPDEWQAIVLSELPPTVRVADQSHKKSTDKITAFYVSLKTDGTKQLFVNNGSGGSGGPGWTIYEKIGNDWKPIGMNEGRIWICAPFNGYAQIKFRSRGGAAHYNDELLRFENGRYHLVRIEEWSLAEMEADPPTLIRVMDPKEFDSVWPESK